MPTLDGKRREYESSMASLAGHRLAAVRYFEIQYEGSLSGWDWARAGHCLDFGLDFEMADGSVYGLTWGDQFTQYDIELVGDSLRSRLLQFAEIDVSAQPEWQAYIGQQISSVQVFWSWVSCPNKGRIFYPQDLVLRFNTLQPVYVSASDYWLDDDKFVPMSDNLFVVFSEEIARRYMIGPYAKE